MKLLTKSFWFASISGMLTIRLQRTGRKNQAQFRVVLTDSKNSPKSGRFKEVLGSYDPKSGATTFNAERINHWVGLGAKPSGTVHNFLVDKKIIAGEKKNVLPKKTKQTKEEK